MPYNSVKEHPGPLKLAMLSTLIFGLVSQSVDRISKFALIKKLGKNLKFSALGGVRHLGFPHLWFRHLGFTHGYHSGRGNHGNGASCHGNSVVAMEISGVLHQGAKLRSRDTWPTWSALVTCSGWCRNPIFPYYSVKSLYKQSALEKENILLIAKFYDELTQCTTFKY